MRVRIKPIRLRIKARPPKRGRVVVVPEPLIPTREQIADDKYYRYVGPEEKFEPDDEVLIRYVPVCERIPKTWLGLKPKNLPGSIVRRLVKGKPPFPPPKDFAGYALKKKW